MKVLIVEDDSSLREGLVDLLEGAGHEVSSVDDGLAAVELGSGGDFDLILLDLMLPGLDGIEVCARLRQSRPSQPIFMLTARGAEDDRVRGLRAGADDYLPKPFSARELLARIEAFERRSKTVPAVAEIIEIGSATLDLGRHMMVRGDEEIALTPREVGILRWLYRHRKRAVSRVELLESIWGASGDLETRTVDMTIAKLRQKIEDNAADPKLVVTVTGVGYAWGRTE